MSLRRLALVPLVLLLFAGCQHSSGPHADFDVAVGADTFVLRATDPDTITQLREVVKGTRTGFPIGPLKAGDGGFNQPWGWHFDADAVRLTEVAIEVCDGTPSYVQEHLSSFPTYCPWAARIVAEH